MADEAKAQAELKDFPSLFSLDGKVAVVTGGSRGLGLHAASAYDLLPFITCTASDVRNKAFSRPAAPKST